MCAHRPTGEWHLKGIAQVKHKRQRIRNARLAALLTPTPRSVDRVEVIPDEPAGPVEKYAPFPVQAYGALCRRLKEETDPVWRAIYEEMRPELEARYRYTRRHLPKTIKKSGIWRR